MMYLNPTPPSHNGAHPACPEWRLTAPRRPWPKPITLHANTVRKLERALARSTMGARPHAAAYHCPAHWSLMIEVDWEQPASQPASQSGRQLAREQSRGHHKKQEARKKNRPQQARRYEYSRGCVMR
jgi:hypothetical protein